MTKHEAKRPADPTIDVVMERLAGGDEQAVIDLFTTFYRPIFGAVRAAALRRGRSLAADELRDLTWDACQLIADRAPSWQRGRAAPWNWAAAAISGLVAHSLGPPLSSAEFDSMAAREHPTTLPIDANAVLRALAFGNPLVELLNEALCQTDSDRNRAVFTEYFVQQALGDPAPADTVGQTAQLNAPAVRQIVHRFRKKHLARVTTEAQFEPLRGLAIVESSGTAA